MMNVWGSNMFDSIWKDQIVKPKGKLGIWKPKEKLRPREEEDRDCCQEAKDKMLEWFIFEPELQDEIKKETCEEFRKSLKESIEIHTVNPDEFTTNWAGALKEILKEWEECENGN